MKKILWAIISLFGISLLLISCGGPNKSSSEKHSASAKHIPHIGIVIKGRTNEFWKVIEHDTEKYAAANTDKVKIEIAGIDTETNIEQQIELVEKFIEQQIDILIIAPASSVRLIPAIQHALKAGIKVVVFDVRLDEQALDAIGINNYTFVGPDNRLGAREVGEYMAKNYLHEGDEVMIIGGRPGAANAIEREAGFMDVIKQFKLKLVASETALWETDTAEHVMAKLLLVHPEVKAVFSANDSMVVGVQKALKAANLLDKVKVAGFDYIPSVHQLMKDGKTVVATINFFGSQLAVNAVKTALDMYNRKDVAKWVKTPMTLVTAEMVKKGSVVIIES